MKQSRTPSDGASVCRRRYASRRRRRARFRTTLPPSRRPTAKATARGPGSRRHSSTNAGLSTRAPRRKSRSNSARDRSRSARGSPARARGTSGTYLARQPTPPLGAPALQHLPAALCRHALAESVRLRAPATVRLERPLHDFLLVRAMRTACPSYRCRCNAVKRSARDAAAAGRLPRERPPCYGVPLGRVRRRGHSGRTPATRRRTEHAIGCGR
jgi:hypothetical protein